MLASGAGLLILGVASLADALADAEARATRDARRAAEATARDLRRALLEPDAVDRAPEGLRFAVRDGKVAERPALAPLPELGDPRDALPVFVRASLDELDEDPGAAARIGAAAEGLQDPLRAWLELRLAWFAHRSDDPTGRDALLDAIDARAADGGEPLGATVTGALLLAAAADRPLPEWAVERAARLDAEEVVGLTARLRERGAADTAGAIASAHASVASGRRVLTLARRAVAATGTGTVRRALALDGALVLLDPERGRGAVVDAEAFTDRLRADGALVVPWSGTLVVGAAPDAVQVVPGLLAIQPEAPHVDRTGLLGFGLVLVACGAVFVVGLFATRRALWRETDALRARADFLTSVTHELKTPLASLRLLAERLHEGRVRGVEKQQEYFALLAGEAARLTVLIENVLDLGRMERGERSYDRRPQVLDDVVGEAVAVVAPLARADGMELRFEPGSGGAVAAVDRGALAQLVVNVLDNARKYAKAGGLVEVRTRAAAGGKWELTVRDHGAGVPAEERERVFARFVRGAAQRDGTVPGVGLGLHLGREIARVHGGDLTCEAPDEGTGAVFRLTLPRAAAEARAGTVVEGAGR